MTKLIINLDQVRANVSVAKAYARHSGYQLVGVLKAVQTHPKLIAAILDAGADSLAFSSVASLVSLPETLRPSRDVSLLLGPSAPRAAADAVRYFGSSIQSTSQALDALGKASRSQGLLHAIYLALRTDDNREGVDIFDHLALSDFVTEVASQGLRLEGLACNLGCTQTAPLAQDYLKHLRLVRAQVEAQCGRPIALSLGGSFILPDLPDLDGAKSVRVGELLLSGSEPAGRILAGCATAFSVQASIVETHSDGSVLIDIGSAILERGHYDIRHPRAQTLSMSGEFMVIAGVFSSPPIVGDTVHVDLGYESLKKALTFPFLARQWLEKATH